jgi:hypothetical protein
MKLGRNLFLHPESQIWVGWVKRSGPTIGASADSE